MSEPGGVLVAGQPDAVNFAVARLLDAAGAGARVAPAPAVSNLAALGSTAGAFVATHSEYLRLTPRSVQLLEEHGLLRSGPGSFWGFVRDGKRITGVLDFEPVDLGPERMLSLQVAAVSFALRAAIKDVSAAVERVEGKVDDVLGLMRAERLGDALGTQRMLEPLLERVRRDEQVSTTDWSAVAGVGSDVTGDIAALRAHIDWQLGRADVGWRPGARVSAAQRLFEKKGLLAEALALLVVAEHNLAAWHELRIAHVRANEPGHLGWTIGHARDAIWSQHRDDQRTLGALRDVAERLTTPLALDGLAPWQRRGLTTGRSKLDELAGWFADQRLLDLVPLVEIPYPSVRESVQVVVDAARRGVRRRRGAGADVPQLAAVGADSP